MNRGMIINHWFFFFRLCWELARAVEAISLL